MKAHLYFIVASSLLLLKQNVIAATSPSADIIVEKNADDNKITPTATTGSRSENSLRGSKVQHNDDRDSGRDSIVLPSLMNAPEDYNSRGLADETWENVWGSLVHISVSDDGGDIWGVNSGDDIYYRNGRNGGWRHIDDKQLKHVTVSGDGKHIWGLDSSDEIWYRDGLDGSWTKIWGKLVYASVDYDGNELIGVNSIDDIYHRNGPKGGWTKIWGSLTQVEISGDGKHIWGVNSINDVYHRSGKKGGWTKVTGAKVKHVTVNHDGTAIWAVDVDGNVLYREGRDDSEPWQSKDCDYVLSKVQVSGDGQHVWGLEEGSNSIYYLNQPPEPVLCAIKTVHNTYLRFQSNQDIVDQQTSIGSHEKFEIVQGDGYVGIKSLAHDTYLRFQKDRSVVDQQTFIGGWEKFEIVGSLEGTFSIRNKKWGTYLRADKNNRNIVDQQTYIGGWEKFQCVPITN